MRRALPCSGVLLALACANKTGPEPGSASAPGPLVEADAAYLEDACAPYLADAPPPMSGEFMPVSDEELAAAVALVEHESQPRCAHYQLAHVAMVIALFDDPRVSQALWEHEAGVELLEAFANAVNGVCSESGRGEWLLPTPSFRLGRTELLGRPVVVIDVLPPPAATTEAHMFAVVGQPWASADERGWTGLDRYFVLEHSVMYEPTHTVMGGWTREDGRNVHLNFGPGPTPTPAGFVHVIGQNLCSDFTRARTTIPRD